MLEPTTDEFNQMVCERFNTSLKQVKKDVEVLKEWIRQQPHLPQSSSDTLLTSSLISSKNRMERAKEKIDNYYTIRLVMSEYFSNRDPLDERVLSHYQVIRNFYLPKTTADGYRVNWIKHMCDDADKLDIPTYIKRIVLTQEIIYNTESFCLGVYVAVDCKLVTMNQILRMTPTICRDIVDYIQNSCPVMVKGIFLINSPTWIEIGINILKSFMKEKLAKRIHIFKEGAEVLEKYIPRKIMPKDYGGEEETSEILQDKWKQLLIEKRDWLMSEGQFTVDESKRIGGTRKTSDLNAMQGSFKTLCID